MAKKNKAPKRILDVRIPKRVRRAAKPLLKFLGTEFGQTLAMGALVAFAGAFATNDDMRDSFKEAAKRSRKSGGGLADLALHLGRAAVLPALVALHAKLPGEVRAEQHARAEVENRKRDAAEAVH